MVADLPVWVTYLVLGIFILVAVVPPRLHFGIRFLILLALFGVLFLLGLLAPDVYFGAFPPLDEMMGSLNGWMVGVMGFVLALPIALVGWGIRKLVDRRASA